MFVLVCAQRCVSEHDSKEKMCESVPTKCFCLFLHPKCQDVCLHVGVLCTKHTSECTHACARCRLGLWRGCLWDAGKLWPKLAHGRAVTLQRCVKKRTARVGTQRSGGKEPGRETQKRLSYVQAFCLLWMEHREPMQRWWVLTAVWLLKEELSPKAPFCPV